MWFLVQSSRGAEPLAAEPSGTDTGSSSSADAFRPPQRSVDKPFRMCVSDVFKGKGATCSRRPGRLLLLEQEAVLMLWLLPPDQGSGFCVTGKIEAGFIQTGDRILAMPPNETCTVKGSGCSEPGGSRASSSSSSSENHSGSFINTTPKS